MSECGGFICFQKHAWFQGYWAVGVFSDLDWWVSDYVSTLSLLCEYIPPCYSDCRLTLILGLHLLRTRYWIALQRFFYRLFFPTTSMSMYGYYYHHIIVFLLSLSGSVTRNSAYDTNFYDPLHEIFYR